MRKSALLLAGALLATRAAAQAPAGSWQKVDDGILVHPASGPEAAVRLLAYPDGAIRVSAVPVGGDIHLPQSLMVTAVPLATGYSIAEVPGHVVMSTNRSAAEVDLATGAISFRNLDGQTVLATSAPPLFRPASAEGVPYLSIAQQFNRGTDEGFYGLGQHQNDQMNYNGEDVFLAQHNMNVAIPFVLSTRNYGLLWDQNSITRFGDPNPYPLAGAPGDGLVVTGDTGQPGWTATYSVDGKTVAERQEPAIDLQYLENAKDWPAGTRTPDNQGTVPGLHVTWSGTITPSVGGLNRFQLYASSYFKVFVDGKEVLDRWRQNWNPWYHNFDLDLAAGQPHKVRIEWEPNSGYIALFHANPRPEPDRHSLTVSSDLAHGLDYYFIPGGSMDDVIAGYRALTGKAPILPKWAYGFWQSRQPITPKGNFATQKDLLGVIHEYRTRGLPLDNIVQDWFYWPQDQWGCQCVDPARYPDPKGMLDEFHANHVHAMISVWAKYYKGIPNYDAMDAIGGIYRRMDTPRPDEPKDPNYTKLMYRDWVGPGYWNAFYDPYNPKARDLFWKQVSSGLDTQRWDGWWLDSDEPDFHSNISIAETQYRMGPTALGPGAAFFNTFPLVHVDGVYQHQIADKPDVRPFILTRSATAGIQRDSAAVWSGDAPSRWKALHDQISAGVNFSMSGDPNWSHDIGGFAHEDRYTDPKGADLDEWRELNTRWFQFGAFSPLFRSHGEYPFREIYHLSPEGSPTYASMEYYDKLRYRLMPYIYTAGADTFWKDGTIMRGLVMDFAADKRVWNIDDEYLFGPALLVAPVTQYKARSRSVYLPAGTAWYDFYTGRKIEGGQTITVDAQYERIPLFVRAGSIVPTGPAIQYTDQDPAGPITLNVYTGADDSASVYNDDGVSRQYLNGRFSRIPLHWSEKSHTLTIGPREGAGYAGMPVRRTINIRWIKPGTPLSFTARPDARIVYTGKLQTVRMR